MLNNAPITAPSGDASARTLALKNLNPASKEYLEAIYELHEEGRKVVQARVGERLGLAAATVSEGIKRLVADGLVSVESREISLTAEGHSLAETLVRRHRLAERMLTDILGIPWHLCHEQAEDWEKVMTPEVERAIEARLGDVDTCPHGNPIPGGPGAAIPWSDLRPLTDLDPGDSATLVRLLEDVELNHDVMVFLESHSLLPGTRITVEEKGPGDTITLTVSAPGADAPQRVGVGSRLAANVWVDR